MALRDLNVGMFVWTLGASFICLLLLLPGEVRAFVYAGIWLWWVFATWSDEEGGG